LAKPCILLRPSAYSTDSRKVVRAILPTTATPAPIQNAIRQSNPVEVAKTLTPIAAITPVTAAILIIPTTGNLAGKGRTFG